MARRRWQRWVLGCAGLLIALGLIAALTFERWLPLGIKWALAAKGLHADSVSRDGDRLIAKNINGHFEGLGMSVSSITTFTPRAWRQLLKTTSTNETPVFLLIDGWKVSKKGASPGGGPAKPPYEQLAAFEHALEKMRANLPRAQILNGVLDLDGKEFRFGVIEWKDGLLSCDFTWPGLNDPAELKLDAAKLPAWQLTLKQYALDIGSRVRANRANDLATLEGYARWGTNRVDFNTQFKPGEMAPAGGTIFSKALSLDGKLLKIPELDRLNARFQLSVTNNRFDLTFSAPLPAE